MKKLKDKTNDIINNSKSKKSSIVSKGKNLMRSIGLLATEDRKTLEELVIDLNNWCGQAGFGMAIINAKNIEVNKEHIQSNKLEIDNVKKKLDPKEILYNDMKSYLQFFSNDNDTNHSTPELYIPMKGHKEAKLDPNDENNFNKLYDMRQYIYKYIFGKDIIEKNENFLIFHLMIFIIIFMKS